MKKKKQKAAEVKSGAQNPMDWYKPFPISSVCRADLKEMLPDWQIATLDDADMVRIASKMADAYCDQGFWTDLQMMAEFVLEEK